jgi:multidrug resistance protein MdtO
MNTIASLIVVVACASAIAGWVATGTELISYAGLQIAFAFFYSVFQGYSPDTDLDNVRNRVVGILFGLIVTGVVFKYIWPERTIDRLRNALRLTLRQLARLLEIPRPDISIEKEKSKAHGLIAETSKSFEQARRYTDLTVFEFEESPGSGRMAVENTESTLSRAERLFVTATSLVSDHALDEWQQLPPAGRIAESELRNAAAKRVEHVATSDTYLSNAFARWTETMQALQLENSRVALVSQLVIEVQQLKSIPN